MTGAAEILQASRVLILPVADGVEAKDGAAAGTGRAVTAAIRDALVDHGHAPLVGESDSLAVGFDQAGQFQYQYVLRGVISEWEDNATEWSGRPDVAALSVEVYDAKSHDLVGSATHRIEGGDSARQPIRFVAELADHALGKIFGWTPNVSVKY